MEEPMRSSSALLVAIALTACDKVPKDNQPVTVTQATKIAEGAEANFTKGDVKAVMAQYADNAVLIDATSPNPSADRGVQSAWAQTFVSMQPADYKVVDRHIQLVGPDAFVSSGIETFTVAAGSARPTVSARFNDVFQRQKDGGWKIVNEHVSMPPAPMSAAAH
jgi:ketosteroid isomerase-like protein